VETSGIPGIVKAKFILNSRVVKIGNYRCVDCQFVLLIGGQVYVVIPHCGCSRSGRAVANDLAVLHDE
jgi:hypothetical protein